MNYNKCLCDGCGLELTDDGDVVVCPECGTPQHRSCYSENGCCVNAHLHAEGFEWKAPEMPDAQENETETEPRAEEKTEPFMRQDVFRPEDVNGPGSPFPRAVIDVNPGFYNNAGFSPETDVDGVAAGDVVSYTQINSGRYVRRFIRSRGKKNYLSWNWGAFFLCPAWFFYRKIYKLGFIFLGLVIAANVAVLPQGKIVSEYYDSYVSCGDEFKQAVAALNEDNTPENQRKVDELQTRMFSMTKKLAKPMAIIFLASFFIPNTVAALIADSVYKKQMLADIKRIRRSVQDPQAAKYAILRRGGVSLLWGMLALLAGEYLPQLIINLVSNNHII